MMTRFAHRLTLTAFWVTLVFVAFASAFVVGSTFTDPGGWAALGLVATWLVPMLVLAGVAAKWPQVAAWLFGVLLVCYAGLIVWEVADPQWWKDLQDDVGPILGVTALVFALPLAVLGLRRQITAGLMLLAMAVLPFLGLMWSSAGAVAHDVAASLMRSQTFICVPFLVFGVIFLLAGLLGRQGAAAPPETPAPTTQPPVSAGAGGLSS